MSERNRVLHVLPHVEYGGAAQMAINLITALDAQQFEVHLACLYDRPAHPMLSNIPTHILHKSRGFDGRVYTKLLHLMRQLRPHVVHTHGYVVGYAQPIALMLGIPQRIHTLHTLAEKEVGIGWLNRWLYGRWITPVAISEAVSASLHQHHHLTDFPTIANGIPMMTYAHPSLPRAQWREQHGYEVDDVLIACVAKFRPVKNHAVLVRAFAQAQLPPHVKLLLVGDGESEVIESVRQDIATFNLQDQIHLLGLRGDIPNLLGASDALILTSDYEGNPLCIMEAMCAGLPVIATRVGGIPELVEEGASGILTRPNHADELAHALRTLTASPTLRQTYGQRGQEIARTRFDAAVMARQYEALYRA
ncbi:MAG: glycosyltransferase [Phototrophicaceae bacterium]